MTRKLLKDDNQAQQERPWAETIATIASQTGHSPSVHQWLESGDSVQSEPDDHSPLISDTVTRTSLILVLLLLQFLQLTPTI